jgi:DNA-binding beta-propeller fold protein YncE
MSSQSHDLEHTLTEVLREEAPDAAPDRLRQRVLAAVAETPQRQRRLHFPALRIDLQSALRFAGGAATVLLIGGALLGLLVNRPLGPARPSPAAPVIVATIPGVTNAPVFAAGSLWAPQRELGNVVRIDMTTNEVIATIPVGVDPQAIAARDSEVWVAARDEEGYAILRLDPATNQVDERIEVGVKGWDMAISGDTLWMTSPEFNRVVRVDLAQRQVVAEITLGSPVGIAAAEDGVWVAAQWTDYVARIDPATNEYRLLHTDREWPLATAAVPVLTDGEVWSSTWGADAGDGQVVIFTRDTDELVSVIDLQLPMDMVAHGGLMWVAEAASEGSSGDERVVAIDIATREIVRRLSLPGEAPTVRMSTTFGWDVGIHMPSRTWMSIATDGHSVWVTGTSGLMRLDPGP